MNKKTTSSSYIDKSEVMKGRKQYFLAENIENGLNNESKVTVEDLNNEIVTTDLNSDQSSSTTDEFLISDIESESDILNSGHVLQDGYLNKSTGIMQVGEKVNTGQAKKTTENDQEEDLAAIMTKNIGVKGGRGKANVTSLKHNYGLAFSFQRVLRKFALFGFVIMIFVIVFVSGATAWAISQYNDSPNISEGNLFNIEESSVVYAKDGKTKIFEFFQEGKREFLPLERIPESIQLAVLALEDQNFYYNPDGIPWSNILGKVVDCVMQAGANCAGASGISQQLVKNVQDDRENSIDRKIRELFTAIKLYQEGTNQDGKRVNKSDILELYLNWIPFSRNSFGVQMASKSYFGHSADARENPADPNSPYLLNPAKACYLAAIVQQQSAFNKALRDRESAKFKEYEARKNSCLDKLAGDGVNFSLRGDGKPLFIQTPEELEALKVLPVNFIEIVTEDPYPHFREYVQGEVVKFLNSIGLSEKDLYRRGLKIVTSIDPVIQKKTEDVLKSYKSTIQKSGGDNASAIILDGPTGQIAAMVGSLDYNDESIKGKNNILLSPQQPGSSVKPYVYAAAFDKGFNPGSIIRDVKTTFVDPQVKADPYAPDNFGNTYKGNITARYALSNSRNVPAVKAGLLGSGQGNANIKQGLENYFSFSENIGVRFSCVDGSVKTKPDCDKTPEAGSEAQYRARCFAPSFIGACEVDGVTHATGINTLLQEGNLRTASPFISIIDKYGQELYTPENRNKIYPHEDAKLNPLIAKQVANVLTGEKVEFGSYQKYFSIPGWKLAGKTGTTNGNRDTWMVGGSPKYTTVVWAGRTDNAPMISTITAANLASPIWQSVQVSLHKGIAPVEFSTAGLVRVRMSGGRIVQTGGTVEFLTPNQINILKEFGSRVGVPEYNPKKENFYTGKNVSLIDKNFIEPPIEVDESEKTNESSSSESLVSSSQSQSVAASVANTSVAKSSVVSSVAANSAEYSAISSLLP